MSFSKDVDYSKPEKEDGSSALAQSIERSLRARLATTTSWQVRSFSIDDDQLPSLITCAMVTTNVDFLALVQHQLNKNTLSKENQYLLKTVAEVLADDRHLIKTMNNFGSVGVGNANASGNLCAFQNPTNKWYHLNIVLFDASTTNDELPLLLSHTPAVGRKSRKGLLKRLFARFSRRKPISY